MARAASRTRSIRPRSREAVSGILCQIGLNTPEHVDCFDGVHGHGANCPRICGYRHLPLRAVLLAPPLARHACQELVRALTECWDEQLALAGFDRIYPLRHLGPAAVGKFTRLCQADGRSAAQAHLAWPAAEPEEKHPLLRAALVHDQIQPGPISIAARFPQRRDQPRIQSPHFPSHVRLPQDLPQHSTWIIPHVRGCE